MAPAVSGVIGERRQGTGEHNAKLPAPEGRRMASQ